MRMPKVPPDVAGTFEALEAEQDRNTFQKLLRLVPGPLVNGKYLHWEDLLRREHPAGIKPELWWLGLKVYRRGSCKQVPLQDKQGSPFIYMIADPVHEGHKRKPRIQRHNTGHQSIGMRE